MIRPAPAWVLPRVVAHRCGGALAPENTLAGLPIAAALGYRAVEFDVMLSADATPWVIHDETLERTTSGFGNVCATPDVILRTLDAGAHQHRAFSGEPLPTFAAIARMCQALGLLANVEIKPATGFERITGEVVAQQILALWGDAPLPLVSSFSEAALAAARCVSPQLPLGYLCVRPPDDWMGRMEEVAAYSLHCAARELDDSVLAEARSAGVPVLCFTVNDRQEAEALLARGVSAVFSDRIDILHGL